MDEIGIAIAVMMSATLAVHLGLPQAIANVVCKVCKCHKCLNFWTTLGALLLFKTDIVTAVALSIFAAYASNWFGLLLIHLNTKYAELWERLNDKRKT